MDYTEQIRNKIFLNSEVENFELSHSHLGGDFNAVLPLYLRYIQKSLLKPCAEYEFPAWHL